MTDRWTSVQLREELARFERELIAARLLPNAVNSYVDYARRFLRWREGDYRPRGAVGPGPRRVLGRVTADELRAQLPAYEADLRAAGRASAAIYTYVDHAARFVRWLEGDFKTAGPRGAGGGFGGRRPPATAAGTPEDQPDWTWEGNVQAALVAWLEADGWTIIRQADPRAGDHGADVEARRGPERLLVEVKGYPQATYARGERAGQPKRWHPGAQARTYFGTGLHAAIILRDRDAGGRAALALPDVPTYRTLVNQVRAAMDDLGVRAFLVGPDGSVSEIGRLST